jgi:hypothetical protein
MCSDPQTGVTGSASNRLPRLADPTTTAGSTAATTAWRRSTVQVFHAFRNSAPSRARRAGCHSGAAPKGLVGGLDPCPDRLPGGQELGAGDESVGVVISSELGQGLLVCSELAAC